MILDTTDTGLEIKDGGVLVDIPEEALLGILEVYPDLVVRLEK